MNGHSVCRIVI